MKVGILETGSPPQELSEVHGSYPQMCQHLLQSSAPSFEFECYGALDNELPGDSKCCDAWVVMGSKFSVYDSHSWIKKLKLFVKDAYRKAVPLVGICFGHQLIAEALGGRVVKAEQGWGCGVHEYQMCKAPQWMQDLPSTLSMQAYHQDQVIELPTGASVLATSKFCANAALLYGDRALSFQGHPEFTSKYAAELILLRRGKLISQETADQALQTINSPISTEWLAAIIARFIRRSGRGTT